MIFLPADQGLKCDSEEQYLERSLTPQIKTLTFLTVTSLIKGPRASRWMDLLHRMTIPAFAILHGIPIWPYGLYKAAERVTMIVLEENIANELREDCGIQNVIYLPLQPTHSMYLGQNSKSMREFIGAQPGQVVFSVLGEARKGKGIELLMSAFSHLSAEDRTQAFFLFAGLEKDIKPSNIEKALVNNGCHGYVDLRKSTGTSSYYVALTEREFGQYVNVTDIGLVLYQGGSARNHERGSP